MVPRRASLFSGNISDRAGGAAANILRDGDHVPLVPEPLDGVLEGALGSCGSEPAPRGADNPQRPASIGNANAETRREGRISVWYAATPLEALSPQLSPDTRLTRVSRSSQFVPLQGRAWRRGRVSGTANPGTRYVSWRSRAATRRTSPVPQRSDDLRERLLNVAVGIERFVRRIVLYFRATFRVAADLVGHRVRPGRHPVAE